MPQPKYRIGMTDEEIQKAEQRADIMGLLFTLILVAVFVALWLLS